MRVASYLGILNFERTEKNVDHNSTDGNAILLSHPNMEIVFIDELDREFY